jgi:ClpP class serine protease
VHANTKTDDVESRLTRLEENFRNAFPQNDLGHPDIDGHRKDHVTRIDEARLMREYKTDVTKKVLWVGVTALLLMLASGFGEYVRTLLKGVK